MTREEIKNTPEIVDFMLSESVMPESKEKLHKRLDEICNLAIKSLEQEPKTGHWVLISNKEMEQDPFGFFYANNTYINYKCSGCGFIVHNTLQGREENRTRYCPNCGAKMGEVSK